MQKDKIMEKNHAGYMKSEMDILTKVDHSFIVQLLYLFQTKYRLYLVLDFVNGGHFFFQLHHHGLFREDLARIYSTEIVSVVSHLHANGIMHRDLKPENILLDSKGHAMLTDFGIAEKFDDNARSNSWCGTLEYMAPKIVLGKGHDKAADWWCVGILLYEMLTGKPPSVCSNRRKMQQKIIKDKIKLPAFLTSEAHSLLKGFDIMIEDWILKQARFLRHQVYDSPEHEEPSELMHDSDVTKVQVKDLDEDRAREKWLLNLSASLLGDGDKSFLEAISTCLMSQFPDLVRVCITTVAWLSSAIVLLSDAEFQLGAFSALLSWLKICLEHADLVEHQVLASMSLVNFNKFPECRPVLMTMDKDIAISLESLTECRRTR